MSDIILMTGRLMLVGVLLNSALYLSGCFLAGLLLGNTWAWKAAQVGAGCCYLSYLCQVAVWLDIARVPPFITVGCTIVSILAGVVAGLSLLF